MTGIYPIIIIVSLICFLPSSANAHSSSTSIHLKNQPLHPHHLHHYEVTTTHLKSWKKSKHPQHPHFHLKIVHGVVNIIGWGIMLPAGTISARHYRKLGLRCEECCYSLHTVSQVSGFILGSVGWGLGIAFRNNNAAKQHPMTTHGILGTIIFSFSTLQVVGVWLQPNEENEKRKYWVIYHNVLGYALIILIIANIFQGIDNYQISHSSRWKWCYGVIVGVLAFTALVLELFCCLNSIKHTILS